LSTGVAPSGATVQPLLDTGPGAGNAIVSVTQINRTPDVDYAEPMAAITLNP